ncbi:helix-turn-helix transcriptional regulator [Tessaracoccus palaemonis]|uniref:WYL domain-containing protein n=1 Tax=Tessaracoccus palaemonis TaxID=2829499 RepID=A0ABX8SKL1_9ACTN|nr:WYL domain-containing protein [Tessaracoccus palaemonis]QXT63907.1 WYL domain-containing protein [Tessaracoccus palaemonis]
MSARKSERLVNLLIALLSTRRYLTRAELRSMVEAYRDSTDQAFERQFERDKQELRGLGIEIETGSNEVFFEDEEHGYRINRATFELPEISFTPEELAALALAGQVWQDTLAADHTARAFEALRAGGADPDPSLVPSVRPHLDVRERDFEVVYGAALDRREVTFGYGGRDRRLQPWMLLQRRGRWYVFGYDLDKEADRFFKLARFTSPAVAVGKAGAFDVPTDAREQSARLTPVDAAAALVAVRDGAAAPPGAEPADGAAAPEGYSAWRMRGIDGRALVGEILAAAPDVLVLDPPDLRDQVIVALTRAAA